MLKKKGHSCLLHPYFILEKKMCVVAVVTTLHGKKLLTTEKNTKIRIVVKLVAELHVVHYSPTLTLTVHL